MDTNRTNIKTENKMTWEEKFKNNILKIDQCPGCKALDSSEWTECCDIPLEEVNVIVLRDLDECLAQAEEQAKRDYNKGNLDRMKDLGKIEAFVELRKIIKEVEKK
jgi:hypothetical protein